jgi:hypothetical protein
MTLTSCSCCKPDTNRTIELFNGKDLSGWTYFLAEPKPMGDVWSVQDGLITCKGTPFGGLYRGPNVTSFRLVVEFRRPPGEKPGNSGIFSRVNGPMKAIPPAVEMQLMHGNAGDVLGLQGRKVASGQPRFFEVKAHALAGDIAGVKKTEDAEKPPGEWNRVEILAQGPRYTVTMNGKVVNEVDGVEMVPGPIGLQSEGSVIQFRRVSLTPMD